MATWYGDAPFAATVGDMWRPDSGDEFVWSGERWTLIVPPPYPSEVELLIVDKTLDDEHVPALGSHGERLTRMARIRWLGDQRRVLAAGMFLS